MLTLTETAACEWSASGVRVNAVAPGGIVSSGFDTYTPEMQKKLHDFTADVPLQRFLDAGSCRLMGRAWSGWGHVVRVEVSVDGGRTWSDAELGPEPASPSSWRGWSFDWTSTPGVTPRSCRTLL